MAAPVQAAARPDLIVTAVSAPAGLNPGQALAVRSTVKNRGTARAVASRVRTWLSVDTTAGSGDMLLGTRYVRALRTASYVTGTTSYALPATIRAGRWNLIVCADATRLVRESREANNCRVRAFTVNQLPPAPTPNRPPVANADTVNATEDLAEVIDAASLLANDSDPDAGTTLTISEVTSGSGGTVALDGTTITFTPEPNRTAPASFSYVARDGFGLTDTATVTVNLAAVNDSPVANDDLAATPYQTPVSIPKAALVANDTDVEGDSLSVTLVSSPEHGSVSLNGDNVLFTPDPGYSGAAGFTYTVSDGTFTSSGHVAVTVAAQIGIETSVSSQVVTEGSNAVVGVRLTEEPAGTVTVTATSSATAVVTVAPATLTFTPANWDTYQYVTLTGVEDVDLVANAATLSFTSPATLTKQVGVTVTDNDTQSVVLSPTAASGLTMTEGATEQVRVRLAYQPSGNATVTIGSNPTGIVSLSSSSLTFTPSNYMIDMIVTVTAPEDGNTSTDGTTLMFNGSWGQQVLFNVTVNDNDPPV